MTNPYLAPSTQHEASHFSSRIARVVKYVPLAVITGTVGGVLNRSPIQFSYLLPLHPLASSGASFGAACAIVGMFVKGRRPVLVAALPMILIAAFHVSGQLLDVAAQRFQEGATWAEFVSRILAGTLAGTAIIAGWLCTCRVLQKQNSVRFAIFAATSAALCVVILNASPIRISYRLLLFWTMCSWQFLMILYLAWMTMPQDAQGKTPVKT